MNEALPTFSFLISQDLKFETKNGQDVRIIYPTELSISEELFGALFETMRVVYKENECLIILVESLDGDHELWSVSSDDFSEYQTRVPAVGEQAFVGGNWCLRTILEGFSLIGGETGFLRAFESVLGESFEHQESSFLTASVGFYGRAGHPPPEWLENLLNSLHPAGDAANLLRGAGYLVD